MVYVAVGDGVIDVGDSIIVVSDGVVVNGVIVCL